MLTLKTQNRTRHLPVLTLNIFCTNVVSSCFHAFPQGQIFSLHGLNLHAQVFPLCYWIDLRHKAGTLWSGPVLSNKWSAFHSKKHLHLKDDSYTFFPFPGNVNRWSLHKRRGKLWVQTERNFEREHGEAKWRRDHWIWLQKYSMAERSIFASKH